VGTSVGCFDRAGASWVPWGPRCSRRHAGPIGRFPPVSAPEAFGCMRAERESSTRSCSGLVSNVPCLRTPRRVCVAAEGHRPRAPSDGPPDAAAPWGRRKSCPRKFIVARTGFSSRRSAQTLTASASSCSLRKRRSQPRARPPRARAPRRRPPAGPVGVSPPPPRRPQPRPPAWASRSSRPRTACCRRSPRPRRRTRSCRRCAWGASPPLALRPRDGRSWSAADQSWRPRPRGCREGEGAPRADFLALGAMGETRAGESAARLSTAGSRDPARLLRAWPAACQTSRRPVHPCPDALQPTCPRPCVAPSVPMPEVTRGSRPFWCLPRSGRGLAPFRSGRRSRQGPPPSPVAVEPSATAQSCTARLSPPPPRSCQPCLAGGEGALPRGGVHRGRQPATAPPRRHSC